MEPIPIVLAGFGKWARTRTVIPFIDNNPGIMKVVAVTALKHGIDEFAKSVKPEFESRGLDLPEFLENAEQAFQTVGSAQPIWAVIINTPNKYHYRQAKAALENGAHVYVERPIVTHNDDLTELIGIAEERGRKFFTGVQRRLEDSYGYLYHAVKNNHDFNELASIRCYLSAGMRLQGWRSIRDLAGGGIILDSGYHLLDAVVWIANASGIDFSGTMSGSVHCHNEKVVLTATKTPTVETTAIGHVRLPRNVLLSFNFTYCAPKGSIFERVELGDIDGGRIILNREQSVRSDVPATVTHQRPDGSFAKATTSLGKTVKIEKIRLSGSSRNTAPLSRFINRVASEGDKEIVCDVCDARSSVSTWHFVRELYTLAHQKI